MFKMISYSFFFIVQRNLGANLARLAVNDEKRIGRQHVRDLSVVLYVAIFSLLINGFLVMI